MDFLAVALGGAVGSCARYGVGQVLKGLCVTFPAGTFAANVLAGLIIGFITGLASALGMPPRTKLLLTTGLCGGLSTFSTFSLETVTLVQQGAWGMAAVNIAANVAVCCLAVAAGLWLASAVAAQ